MVALLAMLAPAAGSACQMPAHAAAPAGPVKLIRGLGNHRHPIATRNPEAQKFFDQGLTLIFAFNTDEAARSFTRASTLDPRAAMPQWGLALALGPNINMEMDAHRQQAAGAALARARALAANGPENERAYVEALAPRYAEGDPHALALAYANAMRTLVQRYPDDLDAATLYAESLMDLRPWKLWDGEGNPAEDTPEILAVLESVLKRAPDHIGANHYYVHAVEGSPHPEWALPSAARLETLVPAAAHLVHMPAHIYMRTGDYAAAARSNAAAAQVDRAYVRTGAASMMYRSMYYNHNLQFLAASLAMAGRSAPARAAATELFAEAAPNAIEVPLVEFYVPWASFIALRFQRWDEILRAPAPDARLGATTALWHFARGVAHAARGEHAPAAAEREAFNAARAALPTDAMLNLNRTRDVLEVAASVLDARLAAAAGDRRTALVAWRAAVDREDALAYDEPPAWYYPVRESLGAALYRDGQYAEAADVFREDLRRNPRNGRSLFGLRETLRAQQDDAAAAWVDRALGAAWAQADVPLRMQDL